MVTRVFAAFLLTGCATTQAPSPDREAVADFVEVRQLEQVDQIRNSLNDGWSRVNDYYVTYTTRRGSYLLEFDRRCSNLQDTELEPDLRSATRAIRARFDTLRGCRIERIYALTAADVLELDRIGSLPADGARPTSR
jgi:hypothetical protein